MQKEMHTEVTPTKRGPSLTEMLARFAQTFLPVKETELDLVKLKKTALTNPSRKYSRSNIKHYSYISPSSFTKSHCVRRMVLAVIYEKKGVTIDRPHEQYAPKRRMDLGTALHEMERKKYATFMESSKWKVWGDWRCTSCRTKVRGFKPTAPCTNRVHIEVNGELEDCESCLETGFWQYDECHMGSDELRVFGTSDLVVVDDKGLFVVVDYKSIGENLYQSLEKGAWTPPYSGVQQLQIYMEVIDADRGILAYVNTERPNQEIHISVQRSQSMREKLLAAKEEFEYYIEHKEIPIRRTSGCAAVNDKIAQRCPLRNLCFNIGGEDGQEEG